MRYRPWKMQTKPTNRPPAARPTKILSPMPSFKYVGFSMPGDGKKEIEGVGRVRKKEGWGDNSRF